MFEFSLAVEDRDANVRTVSLLIRWRHIWRRPQTSAPRSGEVLRGSCDGKGLREFEERGRAVLGSVPAPCLYCHSVPVFTAASSSPGPS